MMLFVVCLLACFSRRPTYEGVNLMYATAMKATGGNLSDFVLNTYMSLHDPFSSGQICGK
jgi:hypothetical protein